jgi:hypothetical protein
MIPYRSSGMKASTVNYPDYFEDMQYSELESVGVTSDKENIYMYGSDYYKLHVIYWNDPDSRGKIRYSSLKSFESGTYMCKCNDCDIIYSIEPSEVLWYEKRRFRLPTKRCPLCRKVKKIKRKSEDLGNLSVG